NFWDAANSTRQPKSASAARALGQNLKQAAPIAAACLKHLQTARGSKSFSFEKLLGSGKENLNSSSSLRRVR
ncbi:hypothetical protein, partial [Treponema zioleckii]|uniref:hypothetical protein n=1 Tax=Treponema zioleckii TaxID=331680 RepID=UPI001A91DF41